MFAILDYSNVVINIVNAVSEWEAYKYASTTYYNYYNLYVQELKW